MRPIQNAGGEETIRARSYPVAKATAITAGQHSRRQNCTAASSQNDVRRTIRVHDMEINSVNRSVTLGGNEVRLTAKEFDLLQVFVNNRGKVFSRESLLETVWKYDYTGDARTVDVHIRRLREKIERNPAQPEFIFTKWGVGYYFTDKD